MSLCRGTMSWRLVALVSMLRAWLVVGGSLGGIGTPAARRDGLRTALSPETDQQEVLIRARYAELSAGLDDDAIDAAALAEKV